MFIVIEGLDGVGKSTVSKALAQAVGAISLNTPSDKFKQVRPLLEAAYVGNNLARQLFYASTALDVSNEVSQLIAQGQGVVLDRYWLSMQVYHDWKCKGQHFMLPEVEASLLVPDLTVFLELPLAERERRMGKRGDNTNEDAITLSAEANSKLVSLYHDHSRNPAVGRWLAIDASLSVSAIVDKICSQF